MTVSLARLIASDAAVPAGAEGLAIHGLTSDSRAVEPGFLFAALPGSVVDGAKFIPQAIANGAVAVLGADGARASVPLITVSNPRQIFAHMAARFFGRQPDIIVAVTGTSGKTSVATFVREIWTSMAFRAASLGTVGVVSPAGTMELEHTTPDPMTLHAIAISAGIGLDACAIGAVKFLHPVNPGDHLEIRHHSAAGGAIRFDIVAGMRKIASGSIVPRPPA